MRSGLIGALMDEYERALNDFIDITSSINHDQFIARWTTDGRFSSIQDILIHVCSGGYYYADYIRKVRDISIKSPQTYIESTDDIETDLRDMFEYTLRSIDGLYELTEEEVCAIIIPVWGEFEYHLEQLLEHAIVHILRHRRQIENVLNGIYH